MILRKSVAVVALLPVIVSGALANDGTAAIDTVAEPDKSRIVAIGGDVTEILYALGFEKRITAIDSSSKYPPTALKEKTSVGYMRSLTAEGVLSIAPTFIIASEGAGPSEAVRALKKSSVPYLSVPENNSPEGITEKIATIAEAVGRPEAGVALARNTSHGFARLAKRRSRIRKPLRVLFVLNASADRMIVGGAGTSADAVLKLSGAVNAASNVSGYKPITQEGLVAMAPEAIVVMTGGRGGNDAATLSQSPSVRLSPAGRTGRIRNIDGLYFLGFGPRTPEAAGEVLDWLYPELAKKP